MILKSSHTFSINCNDVWAIISDHSKPERWLPFIDARRISSSKDPSNLYFPTQFSSVCTDMIEFISEVVDPKKKESRFRLVSGLLDVRFHLILSECEEGAEMEIKVESDVLSEDDEQSVWMAEEMMVATASNIHLVSRIAFKDSSYKTDIEILSPLSEREPNMDITQIERVSVKEGLTKFFNSCTPVVIKDYGETLKNLSNLQDYEWWKSSFGGQSASFIDFPNLAYDEMQTVGMTTLERLIELLESNPNQRRFATYEYPIEEMVGLYRHIQPPFSLIPSHCPLISSGNIWIGAKGLKSPMHEDGRLTDKTGRSPNKFHNINLQIKGQKKILLAHPDQADKLYMKPPSIDLSVAPTIEVDVFGDIDFEKYPQVKQAKFFETTLKEGEALYVPRGWWHALQAVENSINYNVFFSSDDV